MGVLACVCVWVHVCVCARDVCCSVLFGLGPLLGNAPADGVDVGHHRAGAGDALSARGRNSQKVLSTLFVVRHHLGILR